MTVQIFAAAAVRARPQRRILAKLGGFLRPAMPTRRLATALLLAVAGCFAGLAPQARAEGYSPDAQKVLSRAFAAAGGRGWYLLRGWRETGRRDGFAYEAWIDPVRYGLRVETRQPQGLQIQGFNGQAVWQVTPGGAVTAVNDHVDLARARTEAFFAANCFFFPGRFDARGDYRGVRALRGRAYDVVRVTPWASETRDLWFDQRTHLLARIVDPAARRGGGVAVSDYRRVGPVLIAFRYAPEPGTPGGVLARTRDSVAFTPSDRAAFSLDRTLDVGKAQRNVAAAAAAAAP